MPYRLYLVTLGLLALGTTQSVAAASSSTISASSVSSASSMSSASSVRWTNSVYFKPAHSVGSERSDTFGSEVTETPIPVINFESGTQLTRAEFTALVVEHLYTQAELDRCFWDIASNLPPSFSLIFTDVSVNDRYAKHICVAMRDGLVKGYGDGSFRPNKKVNFAEGAKIFSRAYVLAPFAHLDKTGPWYAPYVYALSVRGAIPDSIRSADQPLTARESQEILARLSGNVTWRPSRSYDELLPKKPATVSASAPKVATKVTTSSMQTSSKMIEAISSASAASSKKTLWSPF